jgi:hypothetical protein
MSSYPNRKKCTCPNIDRSQSTEDNETPRESRTRRVITVPTLIFPGASQSLQLLGSRIFVAQNKQVTVLHSCDKSDHAGMECGEISFYSSYLLRQFASVPWEHPKPRLSS